MPSDPIRTTRSGRISKQTSRTSLANQSPAATSTSRLQEPRDLYQRYELSKDISARIEDHIDVSVSDIQVFNGLIPAALIYIKRVRI